MHKHQRHHNNQAGSGLGAGGGSAQNTSFTTTRQNLDGMVVGGVGGGSCLYLTSTHQSHGNNKAALEGVGVGTNTIFTVVTKLDPDRCAVFAQNTRVTTTTMQAKSDSRDRCLHR